MASVKIIARSPGQAPELVRDAWIGLELPLLDFQPEDNEQMVGILDSQPVEQRGGYAVDGGVAIGILAKSNSEAADWWKENAPWALMEPLVFDKAACQPI